MSGREASDTSLLQPLGRGADGAKPCVAGPEPSGVLRLDDQPPGPRRWRRFVPWEGPATRVDRALMGTILGFVALGLLMRPFKPFLLASHPAALSFLTGDLTAIGAAAAFARVGELPLWLVVVAGASGMAKSDWLTWWAGRQWGGGIIRMFTTSGLAQRLAGRAADLNPSLVRAAVVLAVLPGMPTPVIYAAAGWAGMRLSTFLLLDVAGALLMTSLVAGLGYWSGERAVALILLIDRYASLVSVSAIAATALIPLIKRRARRRYRCPPPIGGASRR